MVAITVGVIKSKQQPTLHFGLVHEATWKDSESDKVVTCRKCSEYELGFPLAFVWNRLVVKWYIQASVHHTQTNPKHFPCLSDLYIIINKEIILGWKFHFVWNYKQYRQHSLLLMNLLVWTNIIPYDCQFKRFFDTTNIISKYLNLPLCFFSPKCIYASSIA